MCNDKVTEGDTMYKYADKKDLEMMRACLRCPIPYSECPATADCPHLVDLMNHPVTGCDPIDEDNDPDGDPIGGGDPVE